MKLFGLMLMTLVLIGCSHYVSTNQQTTNMLGLNVAAEPSYELTLSIFSLNDERIAKIVNGDILAISRQNIGHVDTIKLSHEKSERMYRLVLSPINSFRFEPNPEGVLIRDGRDFTVTLEIKKRVISISYAHIGNDEKEVPEDFFTLVKMINDELHDAGYNWSFF